MKINAVLFDCDGLMFNTERISDHLWQETAEKYGEHLSYEFFKAITGTHDGTDLSEFYETVPHLDEIRKEMSHRRFDLDFWASFYPDGLNKKGLIRLVLWLEQNKIKRAVCSSSSTGYVETLLHTVSVPLHFDAVIGGDQITRSKPDPEIFLKGADTLHVNPSECLVLEDSKNGILAAYRAGMHRCFIQDTIEPDEEMKKIMEYQKNDLGEVIDLIKEINA